MKFWKFFTRKKKDDLVFKDYHSVLALRRLLKSLGIDTKGFENDAGNPYPFKIESFCQKMKKQREST